MNADAIVDKLLEADLDPKDFLSDVMDTDISDALMAHLKETFPNAKITRVNETRADHDMAIRSLYLRIDQTDRQGTSLPRRDFAHEVARACIDFLRPQGYTVPLYDSTVENYYHARLTLTFHRIA